MLIRINLFDQALATYALRSISVSEQPTLCSAADAQKTTQLIFNIVFLGKHSKTMLDRCPMLTPSWPNIIFNFWPMLEDQLPVMMSNSLISSWRYSQMLIPSWPNIYSDYWPMLENQLPVMGRPSFFVWYGCFIKMLCPD